MTKRAWLGALSIGWVGWMVAGSDARAQPAQHPPRPPEQAPVAQGARLMESGNILCVLRAIGDLPRALDSLHAMADNNGDGRVSRQEGLTTGYFIAGGFFFNADKDGDWTVTADEAQQARRMGLIQHPIIRFMLLDPYGNHEPRPWRSLIQLAGMDENKEPVKAADVRDSIQAGLDGLFWRVDTSRDGYITREEARAAFAEIIGAAGRGVFGRIDRNDDGVLSQEEVEDDVLTSARLGFVVADQNGDGTLTKQEAAFAVKMFAETPGGCGFPRAPIEPAARPLRARIGRP